MFRGITGIVRVPGAMFRAAAGTVRGTRLGPSLNARLLTPGRSSVDLILGDRTPVRYDDRCSFLWVGTWSFALPVLDFTNGPYQRAVRLVKGLLSCFVHFHYFRCLRTARGSRQRTPDRRR